MRKITLAPSPTNPGIEIVDGLTIKRHVPYSASTVTLEFSPNIVEHEPQGDQPGVKVRQLTMAIDNDETVRHLFDLNGIKRHTVMANGANYDVELVGIGGQAPFSTYDLVVTRR